MPFAVKAYDEFAPYTTAAILGGGSDSSSPTYLGRAPIGTAKTDAKWQIQRITYSGDGVTDIQWAGGTNNFDKVFNSYASYGYS